MKLLIIADDITGLNSVGAEFARFGLKVKNIIDINYLISFIEAEDSFILGFDTNSRDLNPIEAANKVSEVMNALPIQDLDWILKQSDSAFQGNVLPEILAFQKAISVKPLLFAPACPSIGRITKDGKHHIGSGEQPIDLNELASENCAKRLGKLVLDNSRGSSVADLDIEIADAETDKDLENIIKCAVSREHQFIAGSVGIAKALALYLFIETCRTAPPSLIVVGSFQKNTYSQFDFLEKSGLVKSFEVTSDNDKHEVLLRKVMYSLNDGFSVALFPKDFKKTSLGKEQYPILPRSTIKRNFASYKALLTQLLSMADDLIAGIVVAGGATSEILFRDVLNVSLLTDVTHISDGVTGMLAQSEKGKNYCLVTKAGTWGTKDAFIFSLAWIQQNTQKKSQRLDV